jgi:uncharacterized protein (TIGR02118 family)
MYKLMIVIPPNFDEARLNAGWPEFLQAAESMPGLQREASIRVVTSLYGESGIGMVHELFFNSLAALKEAMSSPEGLRTGQIIQQLTDGKMTLLIAEHREDDIENLRKYRQDE